MRVLRIFARAGSTFLPFVDVIRTNPERQPARLMLLEISAGPGPADDRGDPSTGRDELLAQLADHLEVPRVEVLQHDPLHALGFEPAHDCPRLIERADHPLRTPRLDPRV